MIPYEKLDKVPYGGDYNPEQWPEEIWQEDMRLLPKAGVDIVTLNVFSWAALQPSEDTYDFEKLDRIMELVTKHHMKMYGYLYRGTSGLDGEKIPGYSADRI